MPRHAVIGKLGADLRRHAERLPPNERVADDEGIVRRVSAHTLARLLDRFDEPSARDALFRVVKDANEPPDVRGDVAEALAGFKDIRAVPTLLEQLHDPSPEVRFWAVFAL